MPYPSQKSWADEQPAEPTAQEIHAKYQALGKPSRALLEKFHADTYTYSDGKKLPYRLFTPENTDGKEKLPLIVFLHGAAGKGDNNLGQMTDQIVCPSVWALPENQAKNPCFVLAPQSSGFGGYAGWSREIVPMVKSLVDEITAGHNIDSNRIYITGLSMGGYGTWNLLTLYPDFFAAGVPVCGKGDTSQAALLVEHKVPVWVFHGAIDKVVPVAGSRDMVAALKKAGGKPHYTEYPDIGHNSWEGAYTDPNLPKWLFGQRRGKE